MAVRLRTVIQICRQSGVTMTALPQPSISDPVGGFTASESKYGDEGSTAATQTSAEGKTKGGEEEMQVRVSLD